VSRVTLDTNSDKRDWKQFHTPKNMASSLSVEANKDLQQYHTTIFRLYVLLVKKY